jgi:hypothetical protein
MHRAGVKRSLQLIRIVHLYENVETSVHRRAMEIGQLSSRPGFARSGEPRPPRRSALPRSAPVRSRSLSAEAEAPPPRGPPEGHPANPRNSVRRSIPREPRLHRPHIHARHLDAGSAPGRISPADGELRFTSARRRTSPARVSAPRKSRDGPAARAASCSSPERCREGAPPPHVSSRTMSFEHTGNGRCMSRHEKILALRRCFG